MVQHRPILFIDAREEQRYTVRPALHKDRRWV